MWWTIVIVLVVFVVFLWAIIAGTHKEDNERDYEDQQMPLKNGVLNIINERMI